jgi:hypothetical protein
MSQYGIKETKEALDLVIAGTKAGFAVAADGKVDLNDLGHVMTLVPHIGPGVENLALVPHELKDLDESEVAELLAHVSAKLVLDSPKARVYVEQSLKIAHKLYGIVLDAKEMKAKLAALEAPVEAPAGA